MNKISTSERLQQIMNERHIKQIDIVNRAQPFCQKYGVKLNRNDVSQYVSGKVVPGQSKLYILGLALNVSEAWLLGYDVPMDRVNDEINEIIPLPPDNIYMRPIYDSAAAGFNVLAQNTIIGYMPTYITTPSEQEKYIWINVVGDSMSPLIDDGSRVLVKKQESVDSGQIAVVLIDGEEAVVKRVTYGKDWIELISVNPYYPPRRFEDAEVQRIRVVGLVKEVSKSLH